MYIAGKELFTEDRNMILCVDASACKGMHASPLMYWECEPPAYQAALGPRGHTELRHGSVTRVPRTEHASDMLTHFVGGLELQEGPQRNQYHTSEECVDHPWLCCRVGRSSAAVGSKGGAV